MPIECYPPEVDFALPVIIGVPVGDGAAVDVALPRHNRTTVTGLDEISLIPRLIPPAHSWP